MSDLGLLDLHVPFYIIADQTADGPQYYVIFCKPTGDDYQSLRLYIAGEPAERSYAIYGPEEISEGYTPNVTVAYNVEKIKDAPFRRLIVRDSMPWAEAELCMPRGNSRICEHADTNDFDIEFVDGKLVVAPRMAYLQEDDLKLLDSIRFHATSKRHRNIRAYVTKFSELVFECMNDAQLRRNATDSLSECFREVPKHLVAWCWNWRAAYDTFLRSGNRPSDLALLNKLRSDALSLTEALLAPVPKHEVLQD